MAWSVCLVVCVTACSDDPAAPADAAPSPSAPSAPVPELQPGAPGEDTSTRDPDQPLEETDAAHEDVAFMQMMVLHHRQALDLAGLVDSARTDNRQLDQVAQRISAAQAAEILVMAQWLTERSIDVPAPDADPDDYDHAEHGHAGMQGMLSEEELDELAAARDAAFDRLFLTSMIRHHEGAIAMAQYVLTHGADQRVAELATDVIADQGAEIARLQAMLDGL
ncbi:DUF305 domain-containing protein [Nocardioides dilutus]